MAERAQNTIHRHGSRIICVRSWITSRGISRSRVPVGERDPFSELILVSDRCFTQCWVKMALGRVWRVCSVWLFLTVTLALCCEELDLLQKLNKKTLGELNKMGGRLLKPCGETEWLSLNLAKFSEVPAQDLILIVHQTLHHLHRIYSMNLSSVRWAQSSVEHFRLRLDRQVKVLDKCVRKPGSESKPRENAEILKYFHELRRILKQEGYSDCAWENTRVETKKHLQQLFLLLGKINKVH